MPKSINEVLANYREYEKENGGTNGAPEGKHNTVIMDGDKHPRAQTNENTGNPELFFVAQVQGGDDDRRTVPITLRWYTNENDANGNPKPESGKGSVESGNNFLRQQTIAVIKAVFGTSPENYPDGFVMPESTDDKDMVLEVFKSWVPVLRGQPLGVTVKYRDGSDWPNMSYFPAKIDTFEFGK